MPKTDYTDKPRILRRPKATWVYLTGPGSNSSENPDNSGSGNTQSIVGGSVEFDDLEM